MKKTSVIIGSMFIATIASTAIAGSQAKFSVVPLSNVSVTIPEHNISVIPYRITNNTKITRTLTYQPIEGVVQNTFLPNACANPFTLAHGQSCTLVLLATANNASTNLSEGGPVVCKTFGAGDNNPNPFLCSQPAPGNELKISIPPVPGGSAQCWGRNSNGQLGYATNMGTTNANSTPAAVQNLSSNVVSIVDGFRHTCALLATGAVKCWGSNENGQLGTTNFLGQSTSVPQEVIGLPSRATAITAGQIHTCAVLINGAVACWGSNNDLQLAQPTSGNNPVPSIVKGLSAKALKVTANDFSTCALLENHTVQCWGGNDFGQIGLPTTISRSATPNSVPGFNESAINIAAGKKHNCALMSSGNVQCWGSNSNGELGNSTNLGSSSFTALQVQSLNGTAVAITAGAGSSCALLSDRSAKCWGLNQYGQLGNPMNSGTSNPNVTPLPVVGIANIQQISSMALSTCALLNTGAVECWGINRYGQLGNPTNSGLSNANPSPLPVTGLGSGVARIFQQAGTADHACAIL